jgi:hypothetical protein
MRTGDFYIRHLAETNVFHLKLFYKNGFQLFWWVVHFFLLRHARLIFAAIIFDIPSVDFATPNHNGQMTKKYLYFGIRLYSDLGKSKRPDRQRPVRSFQPLIYSTILIGKALLAVIAATLTFAAIFCEISCIDFATADSGYETTIGLPVSPPMRTF